MKEYKYKINGMKFTVNVGDVADNEVTVEVNGVPYKVELDKKAPQKPALSQSGKTAGIAPAKVTEKPVQKAAPKGAPDAVKAPLPGTILSFKVKVGDTVAAGDSVCILEAMKMENDVKTSKAGTVKQILVNAGDSVLEGTDIMIIE